MHNIEPFFRWDHLYCVTDDERSPYFEKEYNILEYTNTIYGYYIHPLWDETGSETLYLKILYADYERQFVIIELIGEWNDTLHNDIMFLKNNIIDCLLRQGINQFILIGENILNFHGSDDCYYEEWFEEVEDGWIALVNFRDFVLEEMSLFNIDSYFISGGALDEFHGWRTLEPHGMYARVREEISRRIALC